MSYQICWKSKTEDNIEVINCGVYGIKYKHDALHMIQEAKKISRFKDYFIKVQNNAQ